MNKKCFIPPRPPKNIWPPTPTQTSPYGTLMVSTSAISAVTGFNGSAALRWRDLARKKQCSDWVLCRALCGYRTSRCSVLERALALEVVVGCSVREQQWQRHGGLQKRHVSLERKVGCDAQNDVYIYIFNYITYIYTIYIYIYIYIY